MTEITWAEETSRKEVWVFHYYISPDCGYYEIEPFIEMVTRFLSFSYSYLFVVLFFTHVIKELPCKFLHDHHSYPWYYASNHCDVKIRILRPSILRFLEIIHHPFSNFSIFFENMKGCRNSQDAYNKKDQLWSMLFDNLKWTVVMLVIVFLWIVVLFSS